MTAPRKCYWLDETAAVEGGFRPSVVVENESGHYLTDWTFGPSLEEALAQVNEANAELGVTREQAAEIIASSMFPSSRA